MLFARLLESIAFEGVRREDQQMDKITAALADPSKRQRGQAMSEYALILATLAIVAYIGYQLIG